MTELVGPAVNLIDVRVLGLGEVDLLGPSTVVVVWWEFVCMLVGFAWRVDGVAVSPMVNETWLLGAVNGGDLTPLRVLWTTLVSNCWMDGADVRMLSCRAL